MKGFLIFLLICGLAVGGYFAYDPYIKPLLEGDGGAEMTDGSLIRNGGGKDKSSGGETSSQKGGVR